MDDDDAVPAQGIDWTELDRYNAGCGSIAGVAIAIFVVGLAALWFWLDLLGEAMSDEALPSYGSGAEWAFSALLVVGMVLVLLLVYLVWGRTRRA